MTWEPGKPVLTAEDRETWRQWRAERKRQQQRDRRARNPRIDYYPTPENRALLDSMRRPWVGGDLSAALNRIVKEWARIPNSHDDLE